MQNIELITELNTKSFDEFTKKGIVFVDFFADWCMPCVMMTPIIEDLAQDFTGKIKFGKVNINDNQDLTRKFNVSSIPNFILFKEGKIVAQFVGAIDIEEIEEKLKKFL